MVNHSKNEDAKVDFSDGEDNPYGNAKSTKEIAFTLIGSISNLLKQELHGGYTEKRPVKVGDGIIILDKYVPDSREAYCQLVDQLLLLLYPWLEDTTLKEEIKPLFDNDDEPDIKKKLKQRKQLLFKLNVVMENEGTLDGYKGRTES